jgi:hypothetical protein
MYNNHSKVRIDKDICNAIGCQDLAKVNILLKAGNRRITISVCDNCKNKFKDNKNEY